MQRELAELVQRELKDPRLGMVTISAVEVSRDLSTAKVYVSVLGSSQSREESLAGLSSASGFLRRELGRRIKIRHIPELRFFYDSSIEKGAEMDALIHQALAADARQHQSEILNATQPADSRGE
jgi:ribosome-binding factor A